MAAPPPSLYSVLRRFLPGDADSLNWVRRKHTGIYLCAYCERTNGRICLGGAAKADIKYLADVASKNIRLIGDRAIQKMGQHLQRGGMGGKSEPHGTRRETQR